MALYFYLLLENPGEKHRKEKNNIMRDYFKGLKREDLIKDLDDLGTTSLQAYKNKNLRVAAYYRSSSNYLDEVFIRMKRIYYRDLIQKNPKWTLVGVYFDHAASKNGFQKLMEDALAGKIDMIMTKTVSRFAQDIDECISWVEKLRGHYVFFEADNLDSFDVVAEGFAQYINDDISLA